MRYKINRILSGIFFATLFWSWSVNAQQLGMSAKAHFKIGDTVSTVAMFAPSAEQCELEVNQLIRDHNAVGHQFLGRTKCVRSVSADDKQLEALADGALHDNYSELGGRGYTPVDPFGPIDICWFHPRLPHCWEPMRPPLPPICMLILCDLVLEQDKYINPVHAEKIRTLVKEHQVNQYIEAERALRDKHDMDGFQTRVQEILSPLNVEIERETGAESLLKNLRP